VRDAVSKVAESLKGRLSRAPTPMELLEELLNTYGKEQLDRFGKRTCVAFKALEPSSTQE